MKSTLWKIAGAALLAGSMTGPAMAQSSGQSQSAQGGNASGGQSSQMDRQSSSDTDWGWIGLLGLIGLAGLRGRRRDPEVNRETTTAGRGPGVYNR
jgi:MYXO-CTERM domain-containing protein